MKKLYTQEQIDEMRKRLYDRSTAVNQTVRHELTDEKVPVASDWQTSHVHKTDNVSDVRADLPVDLEVAEEAPMAEEVVRPKRRYRTFIMVGSFVLFIIGVGISSLYLYFGGNQISSQNIQVSVDGPPIIGGGEVYPLQVSVTNNNSVTIESATLIVKYPLGTRSVGDNPRNLFEERIPLDDITSGEVQNVPIQVAVYGEESTEKQIETTIEYRVNGSNGMFYKDAEPLTFRISSSPLVLRIESIDKVASGQIVDITMSAVSNASTPLNDIIITASYPNGFSFESAEPAPVFGQNVWKIDEILPEQTKKITLQGVISGLAEEKLVINFEAGPANPDNQYLVGSTLAETKSEFLIERPFIDVVVAIDGKTKQDIVLEEGRKANVSLAIKNTLDETVYDMLVEVIPGGNALDENSISSSGGFYDSNTGTVRWEVANNSSFDRVLPGQSRTLDFTINPGSVRTTASFDLVVNVYARRVAESNAQETLIGSTRAEAKYSSNITLGSQANRNAGRFGDSGPVPPQVGETTTYTLIVAAEAGANDIANAIVETSLPVHVDWLNQFEADGEVTYNSVSQSLTWEVGDISNGTRKELYFQVGLKPSVSQVGSEPTLLNSQKIRANDRFTGSLLQDSAPAVTTELSTEMGFERGNGVVVR